MIPLGFLWKVFSLPRPLLAPPGPLQAPVSLHWAAARNLGLKMLHVWTAVSLVCDLGICGARELWYFIHFGTRKPWCTHSRLSQLLLHLQWVRWFTGSACGSAQPVVPKGSTTCNVDNGLNLKEGYNMNFQRYVMPPSDSDADWLGSAVYLVPFRGQQVFTTTW